MGVVKAVADFFRAAPKQDTGEDGGVLSSLLTTGDYLSATADAVSLLETPTYQALVKTKQTVNAHVGKGISAYLAYVKALSSSEQSQEHAQPFSVLGATLKAASATVAQIEDSYQRLFGSPKSTTQPKASILLVAGFLEQAEEFATWFSSLLEHLTAADHDLIPPFRTRELSTKAPLAATFSANMLNKWNPDHQGFLNEVSDLQRKGADLLVQSPDGEWIDQYAHDTQFTPQQRELMSASLRSSIMMRITFNQVRYKDKLDLFTSRKEWLTSKIAFEQAKLRGMDPSSPEAKRMEKACDHYSDLVSRYEQKIERMRAS